MRTLVIAHNSSCSYIHERDGSKLLNSSSEKGEDVIDSEVQKWSDFSDAYCCEQKEVVSHDGVRIPLTVLYSPEAHCKAESPGLIEGYGAYGRVLDKSWSTDRQKLLDRGWVIAFADVRYIYQVFNIMISIH